MFSCCTCHKIIGKNLIIYMFQDNSYCSIKCRDIHIKEYFKYNK